MVESSRGVTIHQMMLMVDRHLRSETYATATAVLVDAQQAHPFVAIWGRNKICFLRHAKDERTGNLRMRRPRPIDFPVASI
jgi:TnpA family transposase